MGGNRSRLRLFNVSGRPSQPSRRIRESLGAEIEDEYDPITIAGRALNMVEYRIYPETL